MKITTSFDSRFGWALILVVAVAFISAFLSLQAGAFALLFVAVSWWTWRRPTDAFCLLLILLPLLPMFKITQTVGTITLLKDVLILTLFARLFAWPLVTKQLPYRRNILLLPIGALILWAALNTLRADELILGILRARDIVLYVLLYFAVLYLPHSEAFWRKALRWGLASAAIVLALSVYQWWWAPDSAVLRFDPARSIWIPRLSSVMAHPSIFGQYLVTVGSLLAALVVTLGNRRWQAGALAGVVVITPAIFLTYSRGVWLGWAAALGTVAAILVFGQIRRRVTPRFWSRTALVVVALAVVGVTVLQTTSAGVFIRTAVDPTYGSNEERLLFLARLVAPMSNVEAIVGRGLGDVLEQNFREVDVTTYDIAAGSARSVQLAKNSTLVDNQHLKTFVELGLIGILIYVWIYIVALQAAWRGSAASDQTAERTFALWGAGFFVAFVLQGFLIDVWDIVPTNAFFWIVAGLLSQSQARPN